MRDEFIAKQDAVGIIEKEMENYVSDIWYKSATHSALNDVNENIKSLKPADVALVVHAHWIRHENADIICGYYVPSFECSQCGAWKEDDSDFCPDCGAKMDEMED